jgi:protein-disulfide isomerase
MTYHSPRILVDGLRVLASVTLASFLVVLALKVRAADAPTAAPKPPAAAPAGPVPAEAMQGLDFSGLTPEQKTLAVSILNENSCDCGCGMKLAVCRRDDPKCPRSPVLGKQVIEMVKAGKSRDEIVKTALTPPTKYVQFPLTAGNAPSVGPANAKVVILQYFDYQCPFCARIVPTLDQILKEYPNDVRLVYKMHPLSIHPNAVPAAQAALAAAAQGKFLEMDKKLFENQQKLTRDTFIALAKEIGLDVGRFTKDIDGNAYAAEIQKQSKEAEDIGATGTPATFVNGRYVSGAKPFAFFKEMIDEEIGWAKAGNRPEFKTGKNVSETAVRKAATGPDPNKVYDLAAGNSPVRGPAGAKVTILHYMDYQ